MPPISPIQAYASALVTAIGNAVIAFGVVNNTRAASVESAVVGLIALGFVIANALHHSANAKVMVAQGSPVPAPPVLSPGDQVSMALREISQAETQAQAVQATPGAQSPSAGLSPDPVASPVSSTGTVSAPATTTPTVP